MDLRLIPHPASPAKAAERIAVALRRDGDRLALRYVVTGELSRIVIPPRAAPRRADGLWKMTCLELFLRPLGGEGYFEFNFSPSREWAAYAFDGYREGMGAADCGGAPAIRFVQAEREAALEAELAGLPEGSWWVGLSAVIEIEDGAKAYWALAHPDPAKPDFHHPDCFTLQLPALGGA
jgi:hypothetical protein